MLSRALSHSDVPPAKGAPSSLLPTMDLPTPRELELETLLRQRDAQVAELTVRTNTPHPIFRPAELSTRARMRSLIFASSSRINPHRRPQSRQPFHQR